MGMGTSPQRHHPKATGHEHPSHLPGLLLTAALLGFTDALLPGAQRVGERRLWGTALGDGMSWSPRCLGTESPSLQPYLGLHRPWLCTLRFLQLRDGLIIALRLIARSYTRHRGCSEGDTHLNAPKPSLYPTPHLYGWPHHAAVLPCPQAGRWQAGVQQGWGHGRATLPHWRSWIQTALSPGVHGGVPLLPPALVHPYCQLVPSCPSSSPSVGMALGLWGGWEILRSQDGHLHGQWEPIMLNPIEYLSKMGRGWDSRDPTYCSMPTLIPVLPNPTPLGTPRGHTQQWKQAAHPPVASWRPAGQMDVPPAAWPR